MLPRLNATVAEEDRIGRCWSCGLALVAGSLRLDYFQPFFQLLV